MLSRSGAPSSMATEESSQSGATHRGARFHGHSALLACADNLSAVAHRTTMGRRTMTEHRIYSMPFARVYPMYVQKAGRKNRTRDEVDEIIRWLTGYDQVGLRRQIDRESDFRTFFDEAPVFHPNSVLITGVVCGVRVETIDDPLMQRIRWLDKLIDELAKGKAMDKILRR